MMLYSEATLALAAAIGVAVYAGHYLGAALLQRWGRQLSAVR